MLPISEVIIPVSGGAWILMVNSSIKVRRLATVIGILAQPFWTYTTFRDHQWGLFTLGMFYTVAWIHGFYNAWHDVFSELIKKSKVDDKSQ